MSLQLLNEPASIFLVVVAVFGVFVFMRLCFVVKYHVTRRKSQECHSDKYRHHHQRRSYKSAKDGKSTQTAFSPRCDILKWDYKTLDESVKQEDTTPYSDDETFGHYHYNTNRRYSLPPKITYNQRPYQEQPSAGEPFPWKPCPRDHISDKGCPLETVFENPSNQSNSKNNSRVRLKNKTYNGFEEINIEPKCYCGEPYNSHISTKKRRKQKSSRIKYACQSAVYGRSRGLYLAGTQRKGAYTNHSNASDRLDCATQIVPREPSKLVTKKQPFKLADEYEQSLSAERKASVNSFDHNSDLKVGMGDFPIKDYANDREYIEKKERKSWDVSTKPRTTDKKGILKDETTQSYNKHVPRPFVSRRLDWQSKPHDLTGSDVREEERDFSPNRNTECIDEEEEEEEEYDAEEEETFPGVSKTYNVDGTHNQPFEGMQYAPEFKIERNLEVIWGQSLEDEDEDCSPYFHQSTFGVEEEDDYDNEEVDNKGSGDPDVENQYLDDDEENNEDEENEMKSKEEDEQTFVGASKTYQLECTQSNPHEITMDSGGIDTNFEPLSRHTAGLIFQPRLTMRRNACSNKRLFDHNTNSMTYCPGMSIYDCSRELKELIQITTARYGPRCKGNALNNSEYRLCATGRRDERKRIKSSDCYRRNKRQPDTHHYRTDTLETKRKKCHRLAMSPRIKKPLELNESLPIVIKDVLQELYSLMSQVEQRHTNNHTNVFNNGKHKNHMKPNKPVTQKGKRCDHLIEHSKAMDTTHTEPHNTMAPNPEGTHWGQISRPAELSKLENQQNKALGKTNPLPLNTEIVSIIPLSMIGKCNKYLFVKDNTSIKKRNIEANMHGILHQCNANKGACVHLAKSEMPKTSNYRQIQNACGIRRRRESGACQEINDPLPCLQSEHIEVDDVSELSRQGNCDSSSYLSRQIGEVSVNSTSDRIRKYFLEEADKECNENGMIIGKRYLKLFLPNEPPTDDKTESEDLSYESSSKHQLFPKDSQELVINNACSEVSYHNINSICLKKARLFERNEIKKANRNRFEHENVECNRALNNLRHKTVKRCKITETELGQQDKALQSIAQEPHCPNDRSEHTQTETCLFNLLNCEQNILLKSSFSSEEEFVPDKEKMNGRNGSIVAVSGHFHKNATSKNRGRKSYKIRNSATSEAIPRLDVLDSCNKRSATASVNESGDTITSCNSESRTYQQMINFESRDSAMDSKQYFSKKLKLSKLNSTGRGNDYCHGKKVPNFRNSRWNRTSLTRRLRGDVTGDSLLSQNSDTSCDNSSCANSTNRSSPVVDTKRHYDISKMGRKCRVRLEYNDFLTSRGKSRRKREMPPKNFGLKIKENAESSSFEGISSLINVACLESIDEKTEADSDENNMEFSLMAAFESSSCCKLSKGPEHEKKPPCFVDNPSDCDHMATGDRDYNKSMRSEDDSWSTKESGVVDTFEDISIDMKTYKVACKNTVPGSSSDYSIPVVESEDTAQYYKNKGGRSGLLIGSFRRTGESYTEEEAQGDQSSLTELILDTLDEISESLSDDRAL